ncbi:YdcF family protein [Citreicella sp. C3M06]|uniref:YdcF family protein n=1 Tax=Citreicella sp. C3M06 TaxID=2841564 RepID=UPI001C08DB10|nr:YdcF family protein [Citreicella sp. C3M06]MBU2960536.1 YdcF family protein [Citreicella sp. C3M06]
MKEQRENLPVALVLGAAVWAGGVASPTLRRRALAGARLWQLGAVRAVIGCGGIGRHGPSEAAVIVELCREAGVPGEALLCEERSATTLENLLYARPLLETLGTREVIVVSDLYHLPRALMVARRAGLVARGHAVPLRGAHPAAQLKAALREIPALGWYALSGKGR